MTQISLYRKEIEKESRRNAMIREGNRRRREDTEEGMTEDGILTKRLLSHLDRRVKRQTRNRWYELSCKLSEEIQNCPEECRSGLEKGLKETRNAIRDMRKMKKILRERI